MRTDERTWSATQFHRLIEKGLVWTVDEAARRSWQRLDMPGDHHRRLQRSELREPDPAPQYQMPFSAKDSMTFIQHPAEFRLELFAKTSDIVKPIAFSFDERGRLWVIEARDYPNLVLQGAPGHDRIKILEDTDGDGRADKVTVFAERLNLPRAWSSPTAASSSAAAPHVVPEGHDGDDKADVREILSTGWGHETATRVRPSLRAPPETSHLGRRRGIQCEGAMNGQQLQFLQGVYASSRMAAASSS